MRSIHGIASLVIIGLLGTLSGTTAASPLADAFTQAWQRQPAVAGLVERERAAASRIAAADAWTAQPPSVELGWRGDRFNRNQGASEQDYGLVLPLWLPGERRGSQALAAAEQEALAGQTASLRLQVAQAVRDAWWAWQLARNERELMVARLDAARRLRDDVARRFAAGDLSRADLNQAEGALAQGQFAEAEAQAAEAMARLRLETLTGQPAAAGNVEAEPLPQGAPGTHPVLRELSGRGEVARRNVDLARAQGRANPELAIATRRERATGDEVMAQTWAVGVRIPLSAGPRQDARIALANAEFVEAGLAYERERERLDGEAAAWALQVQAGRSQLAAAEQRARVAGDNRRFYDKSFRLGETDLPTRLRSEAEAQEAERALGRARIALARMISQWRQSLGLLPE